MSIGSPMTATIPPVGTAGTGYATLIDAFLTEIKGLLEAQIPMSSLLVSELDMQNNPISNVESLGLYEQVVAPTDVGTIQNYQGDLYWVNAAGAVKITDADSLNASGIGGITGDYGGSNPAQWRFDDADESFYGYDDFGNLKWAHVRARDFGIYGAATGTTRITLTGTASPASYTITLPVAPPGSTRVVQMNSSGDIVFSGTIAESISVTGSVTASTTVSATDYYTTAARVRAVSAASGQASASGTSIDYQLDSSGAYWTTAGGNTTAGTLMFPINLDAGDTLLSWEIDINKSSNASTTISAGIYGTTQFATVGTLLGSLQSNAANAPGDAILQETGLTLLQPGTSRWFIVVSSNSNNADRIHGLTYQYKRVP